MMWKKIKGKQYHPPYDTVEALGRISIVDKGEGDGSFREENQDKKI